MTEEVMALPAQFTAMLAEIAEFRQTQNSMLQTQNAMLESQDKMQTDIRALHDMYRRQHDAPL